MNQSRQKEKIDISIGIIVVILAGLLIYFIGFRGGNNFFAQESQKITEIDSIHHDSKIFHIVKDSILNLPINSTEKTEIQEIVDPLIMIDSFQTNLETKTIQLKENQARILYFELEDSISNPNKLDSNILIETVPVDSNDSIFETKSREINNSDDFTNDSKGECIILIGSFSSKKNMQNLRKELQENGYSIFESYTNGLYKIGVYEDCSKRILINSLQIIRRKYAKDAHVFESK